MKRLPQNQSKNIGKCKMASIFWIVWNKAFVDTYTWKNFNMLWKKYRTRDRSRQERRNEKLELTEIKKNLRVKKILWKRKG